jgi:hypothetical protein
VVHATERGSEPNRMLNARASSAHAIENRLIDLFIIVDVALFTRVDRTAISTQIQPRTDVDR